VWCCGSVDTCLLWAGPACSSFAFLLEVANMWWQSCGLLGHVEIGASGGHKLCIPFKSPRNEEFTTLFKFLKKHLVTQTSDWLGLQSSCCILQSALLLKACLSVIAAADHPVGQCSHQWVISICHSLSSRVGVVIQNEHSCCSF